MTDWRQRQFITSLRALLCTAFILVAHTCKAEDGTVMRFPIVGKTRFPSGLQMEVDTRWVEAQGYRPIRIKLGTSPPLPATADRTIRIDIKTISRNYSEEGGDVTTAFVTLPQGRQSISTSIPVLQESLWNQVEIECFEGGRKLLDMSSVFNASSSARRTNQYYGWDQDAISFLVVHPLVPPRDKRTAGTTGATASQSIVKPPASTEAGKPNELPDLRSLALQVPDPVPTYNTFRTNGQPAVDPAIDPKNQLTDSQLMDWLASRSNFEMLPPAEMPLQWLELTGFDYIILSITDLEGIAKSSPKRLEALCKWAHAGGNLVVYGLGADRKRLTDLDKLLGDVDLAQEWNSVAPSSKTTSVEFVNESINVYGYSDQDTNTKIDISKDKVTSSYFTVSGRQTGFGFAVAIQEEDVFAGSRRQWTALINSIASWRSLWSVRNGVSLSESNADSYWNFAIPGFGMAPVMLFVGLITIFVIVLGPVNYAWLKRRNQLSLLIFTVPLGALLTILSLTTYALLGDGISTRVRTWSVTEIDQRTGRGTSHSHQTYYAGIPPWGGLSFPTDAAVYPVDQLPERMGYGGDFSMNRTARATNWDEGQNLTRGFISSRTLSQMVVIQPIKVDKKLEIKDRKVTNQLGVTVKHLLLRGDEEQMFYAESIRPGETTELRPIDKSDEEKLKEFVIDAKPQLMEGFDSYSYSTAIMGSRARYFGNQRTYTATAEGAGILLEELEKLEQPASVQGKLHPRTYFAIVDKGIQIPYGSKSAIEVMSLHAIRGKW